MNLLQRLLRLLLCIALVLNGSGFAMAGEPVHETPDNMAVAPSEHSAMTDCHDADAAPDAADLQQSLPVEQTAASDCCQGTDQCLCDCQPHSPATLQWRVMVAAMPADTRMVPAAHAGRPSPPPQRLIRPPIAA